MVESIGINQGGVTVRELIQILTECEMDYKVMIRENSQDRPLTIILKDESFGEVILFMRKEI